MGALLLSGAVNTGIIGSNGVLNRVAEDGVLPDWFRHPHHRFGTSYRIINLIVALQLFTILLTRGNIIMLGEAYAFGVVWSFALKGLAVLVLRFKQPGGREWKVPLNLHWHGREIPVGLALITFALFALAVANVVTKKVATISGASFTVAFFLLFTVSERYNRRHTTAREREMERFRLESSAEFSPDTVSVRPGNVIVAVRNPNRMEHLQRILEKTDTRKIDIVALAVRQVSFAGSGNTA